MTDIILIKPAPAYAGEIAAFRQELLDAGSDFAGCGPLRNSKTAQEWIAYAIENEAACPEGSVTSSSYLAIRPADGRLVGIIDLRHHIDHPILGVWGGHMGYTVRPSERRRGYAKQMLRQNLFNARARGLERVLLVCDRDNAASERTILSAGGVLEGEIDVEGNVMRRYWIDL